MIEEKINIICPTSLAFVHLILNKNFFPNESCSAEKQETVLLCNCSAKIVMRTLSLSNSSVQVLDKTMAWIFTGLPRTSGPSAGQVHLKTSEYTMLQSLISFSWCSIYGANPFPFPLFSLCSHCEAAVNRDLWWEIKPRRTPLRFQWHVISHFSNAKVW